METIQLKTTIYELIEKLDDTDVLRAIKLLLEKQVNKTQPTDFWETLPEPIRHEIEASARQADEGKSIPHDEVIKNIKAKYELL